MVITKFKILIVLQKTCQHLVQLVFWRPTIFKMN